MVKTETENAEETLENLQSKLGEIETEISSEERKLEEIQEEIDSFDKSDYVSENDFLDFLNVAYGEVDVCGMKYDAGYALKELDPIAFQCSYNDYIDSINLDEFQEYNELLESKESIESDIYSLQAEIEEIRAEIDSIQE